MDSLKTGPHRYSQPIFEKEEKGTKDIWQLSAQYFYKTTMALKIKFINLKNGLKSELRY